MSGTMPRCWVLWARDAVKLGGGDLELAPVQRHQGLHRALAESAATHDDAAFVVLNGTGENFPMRRRTAG